MVVENGWAAVMSGAWTGGSAETGRTSTGQGFGATQSRLALLAALHGQVAASRRHAAFAEDDPTAQPSVYIGTALSRGVCWLVNGNPDAAWATFAGLLDQVRPVEYLQEASAGVGLLAEAALRTGRLSETRALVERLHRSAGALSDRRCRWELELAQSLLAQPDCFSDAALTALSTLDGDADWVKGRLELALGMWLRRQGRVKESRSRLNTALTAFLRLGATPWAQGTRAELRAAGVQARGAEGGLPLSAQELAIARLAAHGCSNREIGQRLFLSPRTVGSHLYRIFPKLDISSRAQLGGLLESHQATG